MTAEETGAPLGRIGPKEDIDLGNAEKIIYTLANKGQTICSAESMTAGGMGYALTRVPGSSKVYKGGVAVYTRETKKLLLGIPDELLNTGLITPAMTLALAEKAMELFGTDYAVAVTGNAGPTTDDDSAGVGTVYWAAVNSKGRNKVGDYDIFGGRDAVREKAITHGLRMLRNFIEECELLEE
jgi:nicotinamide-nucleotide amidase